MGGAPFVFDSLRVLDKYRKKFEKIMTAWPYAEIIA